MSLYQGADRSLGQAVAGAQAPRAPGVMNYSEQIIERNHSIMERLVRIGDSIHGGQPRDANAKAGPVAQNINSKLSVAMDQQNSIIDEISRIESGLGLS